ncbi:unnamed protein product [Cochlearia groenlandica]
MDNLLCDESWLSVSLTPEEPLTNFHHGDDTTEMTPAIDQTTVAEAISIDLEKESRFCNHGVKFVEFLLMANLTDYRSQSVQWLIKSRNRLISLSYETIFSATNYFDRFVYLTGCYEWSKWMVELVAVTSLWIASKYNQVTYISLNEIQMVGLDHIFHHKTVHKMEVIILEALEWRVSPVTSYSFSEILMAKIGLLEDHIVMNQVVDHLLDDLRDYNMVQYQPSVVAVAAILNVVEDMKVNFDVSIIMNLFGQEHKENVVKCVHVMKSRYVEDHYWSLSWSRKRPCQEKSLVSMLVRGEAMNMSGYYHFKDLYAIFHILKSKKVTIVRSNL